MTRQSLKSFDPDKVAAVEIKMWQAYYSHQFLKLLFLLIRLMRESFGANYFVSVKVAFYAARAAADFRLNKGHENRERILRKVIKFTKTVADNSIEVFDYKKAAEAELNWWFVDRYPEKYPISREQALAESMAAIYNVDPTRLTEYAAKRAEAMVMQDKVEHLKNVQPDWNKMHQLLRESFASLKANIK